MRGKADLVRAWVERAESDLAVVEMCLEKKKSLDAACFHAQQAAEKFLKAYLSAKDRDFPFIHDIGKLIRQCAEEDQSFLEVVELGQKLTPYAVEARYDTGFRPSLDDVRQALEIVLRIKRFVLDSLPGGLP